MQPLVHLEQLVYNRKAMKDGTVLLREMTTYLDYSSTNTYELARLLSR